MTRNRYNENLDRVSELHVRILFVVDGRYPATGGAEMQARLLAKELARAGHYVEVIAPLLDPAQLPDELIDGIEVHRLHYPRARAFGALVLDLRFASWLLRNQHRFDVIHLHMMHNLASAAGLLKPWLRLPVVAKVSGAAEFDAMLSPLASASLKLRLLNFGARRLDAFQCISRYTVQAFESAGYPPDRLHWIPNAVDCARFGPRLPEAAPPRVLFAGRHVPVKALDVLLRAWALLTTRRDARLVLIGDGPESPRLRALAQQLGIASSVEFPGMVDDVAPALRTATVYVQPSHQEGLPNAVLEAMAVGLPVVATRVSGHEDVVEHGATGWLVEPGEPQQLSVALQALLDDPDLRFRMGQAARQRAADRFSTQTVISRLLQLYQEVRA